MRKGMADLVIVNGKVLTMDGRGRRAEAIAVTGNRISLVGSTAEVMALRGNATHLIDAAGGSVLPGFVEAHMHLFTGASSRSDLQLFEVHGFFALEAAIKAYAAANPRKRLLMGRGANYTMLSDTERVTRHHLDRIIPDRPFVMTAPDFHTAWANTAALEAAGILHGRDVGVGNKIVMGEDGLATGELRESEAMAPVLDLKDTGGRERLGLSTGGEPDPAPTPGERAGDRALMKEGLDYSASHGITSIHNMDGNFYQLELLSEIEAEGGLTARVQIPFHFKNFMSLDRLEQASEMHRRYASDRLHSGRVKVFVDGVLDSWTAVMVEDYADKPGWRGEPLFEAEHFAEVAIEADRRGLQVSVHAIGDGAVRLVLDGYEAARRANGPRDARHRIEHIEVVHPQDIPRFAELGVIASMQPPHPPGTQGLPLEPTVSRIGRARWPYAYAWRTLRRAGARLVFATDWPVSPIDPMASIQAAVTRKRWADDLPDQRQTLLEAIAGYTRDGAYAEFMEDRKGALEEARLADIVVLSDDVERVEPEGLHAVRPVATVCDGRVSFEA
jgi:hypothetical protein